MKKIIKMIAFILCVCMGIGTFVGCKNSDKGQNSSEPDTSSLDKEHNPHPSDVMFDNNPETYWAPANCESDTIEFSFEKERAFNSISFVEEGENITDCFVEIKQDGKWIEIFHSDEMGNRLAILDKSYTAKDIRLTVSMLDNYGGVCEIAFEKKGKIAGTNNFRTVGYYTASRIEWARETNFDELKGVTDLILFDFGSWDKNGNFIWSTKYDEAFLQKMLKELKEILGDRKVNLWFCLQNYHKDSTTDTSELFATEESRKKLTQFSIDICKKYGFEGVDIDYEYPYGIVAWTNYDKFLNYAATELHKNGFKLSAAMFPGMGTTVSAQTAVLLDYVNIMTYDYNGWDSIRQRHSPYKVCDKAYKYFTNLGFKPEQLLLGLPYYMHFNDGKTNVGDAGYKKAVKNWGDILKPWMNHVSIPTGTYDFNGPEMIRDKTYYAMSHGMSGVFNWCIGCDVSHEDPRSLSLSVINTVKRFKDK